MIHILVVEQTTHVRCSAVAEYGWTSMHVCLVFGNTTPRCVYRCSSHRRRRQRTFRRLSASLLTPVHQPLSRSRSFERVEIVDNATAYCHFRVPAVTATSGNSVEVYVMVKDPAGRLLVCPNTHSFYYGTEGMSIASRHLVRRGNGFFVSMFRLFVPYYIAKNIHR